MPEGGGSFEARPVSGEGSTEYEVYPVELRFVAMMDRGCSWWNEANDTQPPEYVLEHEQIHFALFELEARRLNSRSEEIRRRLRRRGGTIEEASAAVQAELEGALGEALERVLERSIRLDEETSMSYDAERQREWAVRVEKELAETPP
jgi:hypothetical protein